MKTLILLIVFLSFLVTEASGVEYTALGVDCAHWVSMKELGREAEIAKISFVRGVYEGLHLGQSPHKDEYYTQTNYGNFDRCFGSILL